MRFIYDMANFLDLIKGEGLAVTFIRSLVNTTASAGSILRELSNAGIGIRRQTGLQVISYLRNTVAPATDYIKFVNLNSYPTISRLPQSLTKQLRNFAYNTVLTGINTLTGELSTRNITVSSNQLLTKQQALDTAAAMAESENQSGGLEGASGSVVSIFQNSAGLVAP